MYLYFCFNVGQSSTAQKSTIKVGVRSVCHLILLFMEERRQICCVVSCCVRSFSVVLAIWALSQQK